MRGCLAIAATLLAAMALAACHPLAPQPDPTRYYVLTPMGGASQSVVDAPKAGVTIGLGPIHLPSYLDQPWMVERGEGNRLYVSAYDQWGEPLRDTFKDVLKEDLALELSNDQIIEYPWYRTTPVDWQIIVDVINFEFDTTANSAGIRANWSLMDPRSGAVRARGQFVDTQSLSESHGLERAGALSKLVQNLAMMLAQQVQRNRTAARLEGAPPADQVALAR
jgi:uncharacterized protein